MQITLTPRIRETKYRDALLKKGSGGNEKKSIAIRGISLFVDEVRGFVNAHIAAAQRAGEPQASVLLPRVDVVHTVRGEVLARGLECRLDTHQAQVARGMKARDAISREVYQLVIAC